MLAIQPTTADLKAAFRRCGLWRLGWTYDDAVQCHSTLVALMCSARSWHKTHQGKPAPIQPALFERLP